MIRQHDIISPSFWVQVERCMDQRMCFGNEKPKISTVRFRDITPRSERLFYGLRENVEFTFWIPGFLRSG